MTKRLGRRLADSPLPVRDWHSIAWSLLLLEATRRSGLEDIPSLVLHRLQFFSNSLAPIYNAKPPTALVMKLERGPFYPDAQDDIDTLCICGLATIRDVKWHQHGEHAWKTACYSLTSVGFDLAKKLVSDSMWCTEIGEFLHDLVLAYGDLADEFAQDVALSDLTYAQKGISKGDVIPFRHADQNLSVRATHALRDYFPETFTPNRRNQLRMYLKYLESLAA